MNTGLSTGFALVVRGQASAETFAKKLRGDVNDLLGIRPSRVGHRKEIAAEREGLFDEPHPQRFELGD